jgi:hypothetical protein
MRSTTPGYINCNGQLVVGPAESEAANHDFARAIKMRCKHCGENYTANSCDCWQRKCPQCQNGARP